MATRRSTRAAATTEVTEEIITVETRSKRTRAPRKAAAPKAAKSTKDAAVSRASASAQPATRPDAVAPTPSTNKRRLRSTTEADSPLRALDEQPPSKKTRTISRKAQTPAPAPAPTPTPKQSPLDEDDEETPPFFTKKFDIRARDLQISLLKDRNANLEATCTVLRDERNDARVERDDARAEISRLRARLAEIEDELARVAELEKKFTSEGIHETNATEPEFDSFDVDESKTTYNMSGDESALALLRHVQEASKAPMTAPQSPPAAETSEDTTSPVKSPVERVEVVSTPSRSLFSSFPSPFTALKNLFGSSTSSPTPPSPTPPTPTPSRRPPQGSITEVLSMPPTPVGERPKRPSKKPKRHSRMVKALLQGVEQGDVEKATAWANKIAAELQKDSTAGDKRKRLETPVLFRDLQHFPSSKPWQSGFSFPEDVLDLEDDEVVPAWAVYTSMIEEEQHIIKKTKTRHATVEDDDMPASLNELFGTSTASELDFQPRRSIDPSPMFDTPLQHQEGVNVFTELHGHDAAASDRENLQRELKAGSIEVQKHVTITTPKKLEVTRKAHDPAHGSFSVPDSDSEEEEEAQAQPVWTQAPPPAPSPAHSSLPTTNHNEEIERQRQKLMKHTPHKPSRLQQVSYPSPSLMSDAGDSPLKMVSAEIFGEIPEVEPLNFDDDPELAAAFASPSHAARVQAELAKMNWSMPTITYDSDEEEISPV